MSSENGGTEEDVVEKARQLLLLTDLVDKYPMVVAKRVAGLIYLIIAGGISFATLVFNFLQDLLGPGDPFLLNLGFVILSLFFSWVVAFRLVIPLTRSYPQEPEPKNGEKAPFVLWGILGAVIIILSLLTFSAGLGELFPPLLQAVMGFGFLMNYIFGRKGSGVEFYTREHLYFALVILLSIIPMLLFPAAGYVFIIIADMGGIYVVGIYMLITAERLLLESKGQG
jgi:hypothetical protein